MATGTYITTDLLSARFPNTSGFSGNYQAIQEQLQVDLRQWSQQITDVYSALVDLTTEKVDVSGATDRVVGIRADEYARGETKRSIPGTSVAFPLNKYIYAVGWTEDFFEESTLTDLEQSVVAVANAHKRRLRYDLQVALYTATNRSSVPDEFGSNPNLLLNIKALYNADGTVPPENPNSGALFAGTHQHYTASATFAASNIKANVVDNIREHSVASNIMLAIHKDDASNFEGLAATDGWTPAATEGVGEQPRDTQSIMLDESQNDNRFIGRFNGAQVWVKPWAIQNYCAGMDLSGNKALKMRQKERTDLQGLRMVGEFKYTPHVNQIFQAKFGFGVAQRGAAAVHQFSNATYQLPTFPAA